MIRNAVKQVFRASSRSAIDCLREYKTDAKAAAPQLKSLLSDHEPIIQIAAARALASVAPEDAGNSAEITRES